MKTFYIIMLIVFALVCIALLMKLEERARYVAGIDHTLAPYKDEEMHKRAFRSLWKWLAISLLSFLATIIFGGLVLS